MTYVTQEPLEQVMFIDTNGGRHETRDNALRANYNINLNCALVGIFNNIDADDFIEFVKNNAELVRIALGDRDYT